MVLRRGEDTQTVSGSHLLVAAGRAPVTRGSASRRPGSLDDAGIVVDNGLRTTNPKVYAIGDCAGGAAAARTVTHVSNYHAGLVIRSALFRLPVKVGAMPIPRVIFTDPELAAVGLSEEEARARHRRIRILRWPFAENDRAPAPSAGRRATSKAIVTPRGRILGCAIAGPRAGELIVPWALAMAKGLKAQDLAGLVLPYPTFSEVTKRAAVEFCGRPPRARGCAGPSGLVRRFG